MESGRGHSFLSRHRRAALSRGCLRWKADGGHEARREAGREFPPLARVPARRQAVSLPRRELRRPERGNRHLRRLSRLERGEVSRSSRCECGLRAARLPRLLPGREPPGPKARREDRAGGRSALRSRRGHPVLPAAAVRAVLGLFQRRPRFAAPIEHERLAAHVARSIREGARDSRTAGEPVQPAHLSRREASGTRHRRPADRQHGHLDLRIRRRPADAHNVRPLDRLPSGLVARWPAARLDVAPAKSSGPLLDDVRRLHGRGARSRVGEGQVRDRLVARRPLSSVSRERRDDQPRALDVAGRRRWQADAVSPGVLRSEPWPVFARRPMDRVRLERDRTFGDPGRPLPRSREQLEDLHRRRDRAPMAAGREGALLPGSRRQAHGGRSEHRTAVRGGRCEAPLPGSAAGARVRQRPVRLRRVRRRPAFSGERGDRGGNRAASHARVELGRRGERKK